MKWKGTGVLLAVAVLIFGIVYLGSMFGNQGTIILPGGDSGNAGIDIGCDPQVTPDLDINGYDLENVGTATTEATNLYRKVGSVAWNAWTQGTAITGLEIGATYEFVMGISATDFIDNAYGPYFKHTVKCQESEVWDVGVYNDEEDASLSATFYNSDENAAAQAFTAGQIKTVYIKWEALKDEVYGNPFIASSGLGDVGSHRAKYPNMLVLALNTTVWDVPQKVYLTRATNSADVNVEMKRITCPIIVTGSAFNTNYCYEAPVLYDTETRFAITLDADDTAAPAGDGTAYLYSGNFYINSDNGALEWNVETEDGAAVGSDGSDSLLLDFT